MEMDYRIAGQSLGISGSYFGTNKTFGGMINFMNADGKVQSGKIMSLNVVYSDSTFAGDVDFLFLSNTITTSSLGSNFVPTVDDMKNILSNVLVNTTGSEGPNYSFVGGHSVCSKNNLNIPFNCDSLYLASVFQNVETSSFTTGSGWVTIGYELGQSH